MTKSVVTSAMSTADRADLVRDFSLLGVLSLAWNCVNVFGGLSFIFVVGFSAGGLPAILYGFIGSSLCVACMTAILAECASIFPTAGGAYHFATFLIPMKYRRFSGFVLGWINYLAWVLASAACCSIMPQLIFAFVFETHPEFTLGGRYQLFLVYVAAAALAWIANLFLLAAIPVLANIGCYATMAGFVGFTVTLFAVAPKADAASVFVTVVNDTGYSSSAMAVVLGLYNSMTSLVALDASCHMAEEVSRPTRIIPRILYTTIVVQFIVGLVWILAIGFSITNIDAIIDAPSGVPIFEVIYQATGNRAAEYIFMVLLTVNYLSGTIGCTLTASRQGYALARDGGLFLKSRMTEVHDKLHVPVWSCHLVFAITVIVGVIYLASSTGFNAILGVDAAFMIMSYASIGFVMLCTRRKGLERTPFSLGKLGIPCAIVSVLYAMTAIVLIMIPSVQPIEAENMNYAIVIFCAAFVIMVVAWFAGANKSYQPPALEIFIGVEDMESSDMTTMSVKQDKSMC